jgi:Zn-dependent protease with chaperone function
VLSGGALRVLGRDQVAAVLAHEQAHLRSRHDVVMESFTAFYRAVPAPLRSRTPLDAVHLLLEMLADDAARRRCGAAPLREALTSMGGAADALVAEPEAAGRDAACERLRRLDRLGPHAAGPDARLRLAVLAAAAAVLVLPTAVLVVPWLDRALTAWPL